jgi:hypothetical protein
MEQEIEITMILAPSNEDGDANKMKKRKFLCMR